MLVQPAPEIRVSVADSFTAQLYESGTEAPVSKLRECTFARPEVFGDVCRLVEFVIHARSPLVVLF